jgi:hypothetical protein
LGYSFFFGAYFLGYYFFFYWTAGFDPAAGADPVLPILARPLAINLLTSFPLKDSMSLLRSSSDTFELTEPKTVLKSAAANIRRKMYRCPFCLRVRGERRQPNTSWFLIN